MSVSLEQMCVRFAVALALLACLGPVRVHGQSAGSDQAYQQLVHEAVSEYNAHNWAEALALFKQAHALEPNARTLRGIGNAAFELRRYAEALDALRAALSDARKPLTSAERGEVQHTIERAQHFVGTVHVTGLPEGAALSVDGAPVGTRDLELDIGTYTLAAHADGYQDAERRVTVDGGTEQSVELLLEPSSGQVAAAGAPLAPAPAGGAAPAQVTQDSPGARASWVPWLVVGASGAVAITGGVLFALGRSAASDVENAKDGANWSDLKSKYDRAPVLSNVGVIAFAAGLAGVASGLYWHWTLTRGGPVPGERALNAQLRVGPDGLRVVGSF